MVGHFGDGSWSVEPTGRYLYNNDTNVIDMIEQEGAQTLLRMHACENVFLHVLARVYATADFRTLPTHLLFNDEALTQTLVSVCPPASTALICSRLPSRSHDVARSLVWLARHLLLLARNRAHCRQADPPALDAAGAD